MNLQIVCIGHILFVVRRKREWCQWHVQGLFPHDKFGQNDFIVWSKLWISFLELTTCLMFYDFLFKSKRLFVVKKFMSHANECAPFYCQWSSTESAVTIHFALNWSELFQEPTFPLKRFRVRWTHTPSFCWEKISHNIKKPSFMCSRWHLQQYR